MNIKVIIISIINFLLNPILFVEFLLWNKSGKHISFKRKSYILFTANISLFGFGYKQIILQSKLISIIFELDHYIDEKVLKNNTSINAKVIMDKKYFSYLIADVIKIMDIEKQERMLNSINDFIDFSLKIRNIELENYKDYLKYAYITIGVPCSANLVSVISNEEFNLSYIEKASKIIRILNDLSTVDKDLKEENKNILFYLNFEEIKNLLHNMRDDLDKFKPKSKPERFINRLVKISYKLYSNNKDFEI